MAWLNAIPKAANEKSINEKEIDKRSRIKRMDDDGLYPALPTLSLPHLIMLFFDAGPALASGMGPAPLSEESLGWFQRNTGLVLSPWESRILKRLSIEWIAESQKAEANDAPPPYVEVADAEYRREVLPDRIRSFLRD